jgi:uncharacterized membrane protein YhaH (DUF805 family)
MRMVEAARHVLSNYATFSGRAGRAEFWWWILAIILAQIAAGLLDGLLFGSDEGGGPLAVILTLATIVPHLAVCVRRLHDLDRTGWWLLLTFIPVIGALVLIYFYVQSGTPGPNRFGPPAPAI